MKKLLLVLLVTPATHAMLKQAIPCDKDRYAIESMPVEEKTLVQALLTNKESQWNTHCPEISKLLAQSILHNHPIVPFLLKQINLPPGTLQDYTDEVWSVYFNKDGDKIVTILKDGTAKIWNAEGTCLATLQDIRSVKKINKVGDKILTISQDGQTAKVWDANNGTCLATLRGHTSCIYSAKFNKAENQIVSASTDKTAKIWDASTGTCLATLEGHTDTVYSAQFNKDGDKILTTSRGHTAKIWDAKNGSCLATLRGHTDTVWSANFNKTGNMIVTASDDKTARIWDANNGTCLATLEGHTDTVWSAKFNKDGNLIVTASDDKTARIWDVMNGSCLATLEGHTAYVNSAKFNEAGNLIVTASDDKTARIWDVMTGSCLATFQDIRSAEFKGTTNKIVTSSSGNNTVKIWDVRLLVEIPQFLARKVTLQQAFILNAIYEVMIARTLIKKHGKSALEVALPSIEEEEDKSSLESITAWLPHINSYLLEKTVRPEEICFDFNTYPHLQQHYEDFPQEIQDTLEKYITRKTSSFEAGTSLIYPRYALLALCTAAALWAAKKTLFDKPTPNEQTNETIDKTREETV